jgi:hypothetical protein
MPFWVFLGMWFEYLREMSFCLSCSVLFVMSVCANAGSCHNEAEKNRQVDRNVYRIFEWNFSTSKEYESNLTNPHALLEGLVASFTVSFADKVATLPTAGLCL